MHSDASNADEYVRQLPENRRTTISAVRAMILKNLPAGLHETMAYGMISYSAPADKSPKTYNGQPLSLIGLASQKQYCSLYLMCMYASKEREAKLRREFQRIGKKLNMGKCCIRFKSADDLPLDAIGKIIADTNPAAFLKMYEASHTRQAVAKRHKMRQKASAK